MEVKTASSPVLLKTGKIDWFLVQNLNFEILGNKLNIEQVFKFIDQFLIGFLI
jgi:hypothetical protein